MGIKKKSQIASQPILYILFIIIFAFVLLLGYQFVKDIGKKEERTTLIFLKTQLASDINSVDYGDIKIEKYNVPTSIDEICFVDLNKVNPSDIMNHPMIKDSVESGVKENIFLKGKKYFETIYVEDLVLSNYPYFSCIQSKIGSVKLRIEGKGNIAVIKTPSSQKYCQNAQDGGLCDGLDIVFGPGYKSECCKEYGLCC